ncbi:NlpC/P60 family protein [Antrihabitans sp. NCIMB 15449]|uniref:NlpC/P60 family protein n=1 Tax=Antrihabitans spumae TaxID=3373370 RepID=A0ABW7JQI3_9NOCA
MKQKSSSRGRPRTATTAARALIGMIVAVALAAAVPGTSAAVPPPPPNPSDSDIAQADNQVQAQLGNVGELINQVAAANEQLRQLDDAVAAKREEVNKALVDLQNARSAVDAAAAFVGTAQQALVDAGAQIDQAQTRFDGYAAQSYMQGNAGAASVGSYLGSKTPDDVMNQAQLLQLVSSSQEAVVDNLQRARTAQANKDSSARKAKQDADVAAADAEAKKGEAEQAIAVAQSALAEQANRKQQIEDQRASAQAQLDSARSNVAGLQDQRSNYEQWDTQRQFEEQAIAAAAETAQELALQAAARVAANQAARDRAAELSSGQRPHTQVEDDDEDSTPAPKTKSKPKSKTKPKVTGSAAVETVIDRGMSQLGVTYAWGGGDENGPTKGIKDGGVADSHGDYKKVGFDSSGLMVYAFAGIGISLPHYSGYQYTSGEQVPIDEMERGDMLFWGPNGSQHVALYLGDGKMLEAPQSGDVVKISPVREGGIMPYAVRLTD